MTRQLVIFLAAPLLVFAQTSPRAGAVVNGASFSGRLCPGALASLFGTNLATDTTSAPSLPLPSELLGTRVLVQDPSMPNPIMAPLYFVSPGQINFQIPFEVVRTNISISVSTLQGASNALNVTLSPMAPGLFSRTSNGAGTALVFDSAFKPLTDTPSLASTVIFYATGLGVTTPSSTSGFPGNSTPPFNQVATPFDVYIGGSKATVSWVGLAPGFAGVYQLNVIPAGEAVGDVVITCSTCTESNRVRMPDPPVDTGDNTANAIGSVAILYPASHPSVTFSPAFVVARTTARFDIKPNAGRFTLSVSATIGSVTVDGTTIQFDPVLGQFTATVPSPTTAVRYFDFSALLPAVKALDFMCGPTSCPMPGNIVPASRVDSALSSAIKDVQPANSAPKGPHSFYTVTGGAKSGTTFTLGGTTNVDLVTFASFASISYPTSDVPVSVKLYIDGRLIDATTATYKPPQ
jgi:uncharacterized protein (TIGR03437 family)